jgi:hypothetical protein
MVHKERHRTYERSLWRCLDALLFTLQKRTNKMDLTHKLTKGCTSSKKCCTNSQKVASLCILVRQVRLVTFDHHRLCKIAMSSILHCWQLSNNTLDLVMDLLRVSWGFHLLCIRHTHCVAEVLILWEWGGFCFHIVRLITFLKINFLLFLN